MEEKTTSCIKRVGGIKICKHCNNVLIKYGKSSANKTRYRCNSCKKTQIENYTYKAYSSDLNRSIISLTKEGVGIRSIARLLEISTNTLLSRLILIAKNIKQPEIVKRRIFQVDEMRTFIKRKTKLIWIVYALDQKTKNVVSFNIGRRTNKTLRNVILSLELSDAKMIITDKLPNYKFLIKKKSIAQNLEGLIT